MRGVVGVESGELDTDQVAKVLVEAPFPRDAVNADVEDGVEMIEKEPNAGLPVLRGDGEETLEAVAVIEVKEVAEPRRAPPGLCDVPDV